VTRARRRDARVRGCGVRDAGVRDAGVRGAGVRGAGVRDADVRDAGVRDAGVRDAGVRDAGVRDAGVRDAGVRDAGVRDAGVRDAGVRDAGVRDAGVRDAGMRDASDRSRSRLGAGRRALSPWFAAVAGLGLACRPGVTAPAAARGDRLAIALYTGPGGTRYGVVDDRRWVEIAGDALVLDRVDPGAELPSLVIEPLAGGALVLGACLRDRIGPPPDPPPSAVSVVGTDGAAAVPVGSRRGAGDDDLPVTSILRCAAHGRPGRYLVRVLYVSPALGYRAQHEVAASASGSPPGSAPGSAPGTAIDRAIVTSRFVFVTPAWRTRAEVAVFDGAPGGESPPRELARGPITLDGGIAVLATPARAVAGHLRRIYDGAAFDPERRDARDPRWGRASHASVWVWLELGDTALAPGPVHARVALGGDAIRDIDVPAEGVRRGEGALRLPLWIDDQLRGKRDRWTEASDDTVVNERFAVSIANTGDTARDVWIEEPLRPASRRSIVRAWPGAAELGRRHLRMKLTVAPGAIERAGFTIGYPP